MKGEIPAGFVIRKGVPSDAKPFLELDRICFPPHVAFSLATFRYHLRDPKSINLVAEKSTAQRAGHVPGFIVAGIYTDVGQVVTMDVHPDHRRKGLGRMLLAECENEMRKMGAVASVLQVAVDNTAAMGLYSSAGYAKSGRIQGYYAHPAPRGTDAFFMEKEL